MAGPMWQELLTGIALMMVIEGIFPFINPTGMRRMLMMLLEMDDRAIRFLGLTSMVCGVGLLLVVR